MKYELNQFQRYETLAQVIQHLLNLDTTKNCTVEIKGEGTRTLTQNNAIHLWCDQLGKALNDAGYDQRAVFAQMREGVSIPWRDTAVKESLWKPIQAAIVGKDSTTKLSTTEVSEVYEILNRWTAEKFGVSVPFPSRERG
jgi:hypothetical protein